MAAGRARQLRWHAVTQAQLVWVAMNETPGDVFQRYIESGVLGDEPARIPPNPLVDLIVADIEANGGKLIVDQTKFDRMLEQVQHGKP